MIVPLIMWSNTFQCVPKWSLCYVFPSDMNINPITTAWVHFYISNICSLILLTMFSRSCRTTCGPVLVVNKTACWLSTGTLYNLLVSSAWSTRRVIACQSTHQARQILALSLATSITLAVSYYPAAHCAVLVDRSTPDKVLRVSCSYLLIARCQHLTDGYLQPLLKR
jgi:hypothetical protein